MKPSDCLFLFFLLFLYKSNGHKDLATVFDGAGDDPGNVRGVRYCTPEPNRFRIWFHCGYCVGTQSRLDNRAKPAQKLGAAELVKLMQSIPVSDDVPYRSRTSSRRFDVLSRSKSS